ncbi:aminotransferase [Arenibaculum sp.]|jgi:aspartate/methionine/tyrosine aminotransferase|uniref:aminotransferase n=1 Tax=Arenibaculum sp. TaxID=2865862 RepID=UPI002E13979C|nr:aminotransferase [Arenibaculum sp.]
MTPVPPVNPLLAAVETPPVAEARNWVRGRSFPADRPLVDLAQAVPGHPPADALIDHLAVRLRDPQVHRYTDVLGEPELREAHAGHMSTFYGSPVAPGQVAITAGCNQAFCLAVMAVAGAGDDVILPLPYYFNHSMWLGMMGVGAVHLPFRPEAAGVPDVEQAARLIGPRTRAIVLVTPNNPTGAVLPPATIRAFFDLARQRGIALILDETYKDFVAGGEPPHRLFADPDWGGTLIQLYSFSKVFALTGYRVGSLIASERMVAQVEKALDTMAICAPRIGQDAALFGLTSLGDWVADNSRAMGRRADAFHAGLSSLRGWRLVSLGAYFAYMEHPLEGVRSDVVARRLVDEHNLLALPGTMFGPGQERFLRLAFANVDEGLVPVVVERLRAAAG